MRLTRKLYAQHLGWMFKKHWQVQGKRIAADNGALAEVKKHGIEVKHPMDVVKTRIEPEPFDGCKRPITDFAHNKNHPIWQAEPCYKYANHAVLLEGMSQAQVLTNTIEIPSLPSNLTEAFNRIQITSEMDSRVRNCIMAAHINDAEQTKVHRSKIPERPTQNLPRNYGISNYRQNRLLTNKFILECERYFGYKISSRRKLVNDVDFKVVLPRNKDILHFTVAVGSLVAAEFPLTPIKATLDGPLPELNPIQPTITMEKTNFYTTDTFFPLSSSCAQNHPHTVFLNFDKENIGNIRGSSVTSSQFESRNMLTAFGVAAARARQLNTAASLDKLEKPIVVQSIQSNGQTFHFGVFQLNSLSLANNGKTKNYWFHLPSIDLFTECINNGGRPSLRGYNKDVFRYICAFYSSI